MAFTFIHGNQGDISIHAYGSNIGLGHNYLLKLPIMLWTYNMQATQDNLFKGLNLHKSYDSHPAPSKYDLRDLEDLLEESINFAKELPLPTDEFNLRNRISGFMTGNHKAREFELREDGFLYLMKKEEDNSALLMINPNRAKELAASYFRFINTEPKIGLQGSVKHIFNTLKEFKK